MKERSMYDEDILARVQLQSELVDAGMTGPAQVLGVLPDGTVTPRLDKHQDHNLRAMGRYLLPTGKRISVLMDEPDQKTDGNIYIAERAQAMKTVGTVLEVGPLIDDEQIARGDRVLIAYAIPRADGNRVVCVTFPEEVIARVVEVYELTKPEVSNETSIIDAERARSKLGD